MCPLDESDGRAIDRGPHGLCSDSEIEAILLQQERDLLGDQPQEFADDCRCAERSVQPLVECLETGRRARLLALVVLVVVLMAVLLGQAQAVPGGQRDARSWAHHGADTPLQPCGSTSGEEPRWWGRLWLARVSLLVELLAGRRPAPTPPAHAGRPRLGGQVPRAIGHRASGGLASATGSSGQELPVVAEAPAQESAGSPGPELPVVAEAPAQETTGAVAADAGDGAGRSPTASELPVASRALDRWAP